MQLRDQETYLCCYHEFLFDQDMVEEEANKERRRSSAAVADEIHDEEPAGDGYEDDFEVKLQSAHPQDTSDS